MKGKIPDSMPRELKEQKCADLMSTVQGFCNQSKLPRTEIVGALEAVKFALLSAWLKENEGDDEY